jgi:hypothetical protein
LNAPQWLARLDLGSVNCSNSMEFHERVIKTNFLGQQFEDKSFVKVRNTNVAYLLTLAMVS